MSIKILVCGSAGFLMSNFLRYVFYRSKEFKIVSVDYFENPKSYPKLYKHNLHTFYLGNLCDKDFLSKLIELEKPDFILNSISCDELYDKIRVDFLQIFKNLYELQIPMMQLIPSEKLDILNLWGFLRKDNQVSETFINNGGLTLEIPNCFGMRQQYNKNIECRFVNVIKNIIDDNDIVASSKLVPWVFSEDVASFIWFLIEKRMSGFVQMPQLGYKSMCDMAKIAMETLGKKSNIITIPCFLDDEYSGNSIEEWIPDSISLEKSVIKTVKWFDVNRWAL